MTSSQHAVIESTDVDDHAASLSNWDQKYEQISPGHFKGRLEEVRLGPVHLFREIANQAVLMRGTTTPGTLTLALTVGGQQSGWFCGHLIETTNVVRLAPGREFEMATRGAFDLVAVDVDAAFLNSYSLRVNGIELVDARDLHQILDGSVCGAKALLLGAMAAVLESSRLIEQGPAQRALVQSLCDQLITCSSQLNQLGGSEGTAATRQRVVREARHYMSNHADEAITVGDLCAAIHVSRRTLQYSFEDVLQVSPVTYLRVLRLNGMRRDLRRGGDESVGDRCARWGFWHLSHFATDYRHMFGELPSETLRRARAEAKPR